jgi:DNA-binding transcriptional MerR regulator
MGVFSRMTGLSQKALRLYDQSGLLCPARVNGETRYRYYLPGQLSDAMRIKMMRQLGVSLDDIKVLMEKRAPDEINDFLERQADKLKRQIWERERALLFLEQLMRDYDSVLNLYEVTEAEFAGRVVISIREEVAKKKFDERVAEHRDRLTAFLASSGVRPAGHSMALLHHEELSPKCFDLETCVPVERAVGRSGDIVCRTLAGASVIKTTHAGAYDGIEAAYGALLRWMENHSRTPLRPMMEIYVAGPDGAARDDCRTEVLWPVSGPA